MNFTEEAIKRFWSKVDHSGECWLWTAGKYRDGYGSFWHHKDYGAHRVSFFLATGRTPGVVMHTCDNPLCVRPEHLVDGTHGANVQDKVLKGRQAKGEGHGRTKLTAPQVLEIRARAKEGTTALAKEFKVSPKAVRLIIQRKNWAWL